MKSHDYVEKAIHVTRREFLQIIGVAGAVMWSGLYVTTDLVQDRSQYVKKRITGLYRDDIECQIRQSHNNPALQAMYRAFAQQPLSPLSEELFHTHYVNRTILAQSDK